jgi:hypothetical protein
MGYRPQFAYPPAPGNCRDEEFEYYFDRTNTPGLAVTLTPGQQQNNIPLVLDKDAVFLCRGIKIGNPSSVLGVQFKDPSGNPLSDNYEPAADYSGFSAQSVQPGAPPRALEPEIECPAGAALLLNIKDIDPPTPAVMYGASTVFTGALQMETYAVGGAGQGAPVIVFQGALYQVLQWDGGAFPAGGGSINVFKSTDQGQTWTILDYAHSPNDRTDGTPCAGVWFDGAHTLTIADTAGSPITPATSAIVLYDFNLLTGTWGAAYGAGSTAVYSISQFFKRSDGSVVVIALDSATGSSIMANVLASGVWSQVSLTTGLPGGWVANGSSSAVIDPATDTIHMFGFALVGGVTHKSYYQQFTLANAVAGFQDLTAVFFPQPAAMGSPLILSGNLLWGVVDTTKTFATILLGTPLSAPVFTVAPSPGTDPGQPIPGNPAGKRFTLQPTLATDGSRVYSVLLTDATGSNQVRLSSTSNTGNPLLGWNGSLVYDDAVGTVPLFDLQYPTISVVSGVVYLTFQGSAPGAGGATGQPTNYFMEVAQGQIAVTLRGVKRYPAVRHTSACAVV